MCYYQYFNSKSEVSESFILYKSCKTLATALQPTDLLENTLHRALLLQLNLTRKYMDESCKEGIVITHHTS